MSPYVQTLRRTWRLFVLPLVIATGIGGWFTFGQPKTYRSVADLWVDATAPAGSPNGSAADSPLVAATLEQPAAIEQIVLSELLATESFDLKVGDDSPLRHFLQTAPRQGFSPTALLARRNQNPLGYRVATAVGTGVEPTVLGPDLLQLSFAGATPAIAQGVLTSLIAHLKRSQAQFGRRYEQVAFRTYQTAVADAQANAQNAQQSLTAYERTHPTVAGGSDNIFVALERRLRTTAANLATATSQLNQTTSALNAGTGSASVRLVQRPTLQRRPLESLGDELLGPILGLGAGLILMLVGIICLTPPSQQRWDTELRISHRRSA